MFLGSLSPNFTSVLSDGTLLTRGVTARKSLDLALLAGQMVQFILLILVAHLSVCAFPFNPPRPFVSFFFLQIWWNEAPDTRANLIDVCDLRSKVKVALKVKQSISQGGSLNL